MLPAHGKWSSAVLYVDVRKAFNQVLVEGRGLGRCFLPEERWRVVRRLDWSEEEVDEFEKMVRQHEWELAKLGLPEDVGWSLADWDGV